jgi:IS5 family transposase
MSTQFHLAITTGGGENVNDREAAPELVGEVIGYLVMADRGYDRDEFRRILKGNNHVPVMPRRKHRKKAITYDEQKYQRRSFIEWIFGTLKEHCRLTIRYEKSDMNFL